MGVEVPHVTAYEISVVLSVVDRVTPGARGGFVETTSYLGSGKEVGTVLQGN